MITMSYGRYKTYSEIPASSVEYVVSVSGVKNIYQLTMTEINNFLSEVELWLTSSLLPPNLTKD